MKPMQVDQAVEWCNLQRKDPVIGNAVQELQSLNPVALAVVVSAAVNDAYVKQGLSDINSGGSLLEIWLRNLHRHCLGVGNDTGPIATILGESVKDALKEARLPEPRS